MVEFFLAKGVLILGLCFLVDDLGVPFPSGSVLFAAAVFSAHKASFSPWVLFLVAACYSSLGNFLLYVWGRHGAKKWLHTHGHKLFLPQSRLEKFEEFFEKKHGQKTIFLSSLVNNVRPYMSLLAGSSGMSPAKFFPVNILGICIWAGGITAIGYNFGEEIWELLKNYWQILIIAVLLLILFKIVWKRLFFGKK